VSLYKIDHPSLPSCPQMKICAHRLIDVEGDDRKQTASVIDGTCWPPKRFLFKRRAFMVHLAAW
jgi:hypothetical protein